MESGFSRVEIELPENLLRSVSTLLAYGIKIEAPVGISIHDLLSGILKIDAAYLENRVQTILHDGRPVDDIFEHRVWAPSSIALSAALPGLFGAAYRKKGVFSPLRPKAGASDASNRNAAQTIEVTIKLFNLVAAALGPELLRNGIRIEREPLLRFIRSNPDFETSGMIAVRMSGKAMNLETLIDRLASNASDVLLMVSERE